MGFYVFRQPYINWACRQLAFGNLECLFNLPQIPKDSVEWQRFIKPMVSLVIQQNIRLRLTRHALYQCTENPWERIGVFTSMMHGHRSHSWLQTVSKRSTACSIYFVGQARFIRIKPDPSGPNMAPLLR